MDRPLSPHWADQTAFRVVKFWGDRPEYTVASGITPSGVVHIGNFREVITVVLVALGLEALGKKVRFIYSWDDFDTFRKVPKNLPNPDMLKENLRKPISRVPDPFGTEPSYSAHNARVFERELALMGVAPEFQYQHERYSAGRYAEGIHTALESLSKIKASLNEFRSEPLPADWLPTSIYCESCDRDEMVYERYDGDWKYAYKCASCAHEAVTDIRTTKNLKLAWRVDWPMRWAHYQVDFEPGGKDHSSDGGSYDTAKNIIKAVWDREPPQYLQYDFVAKKGGGGKMSSSSGDVFTLSDALEVYDPQVVRWMFANQRPNHDFSIAFDEDVIKTHEEFDRAEAEAFSGGGGKNAALIKRTYELSCFGKLPPRAPFRAPFRDLASRLQICDGDVTRTRERFYQAATTDAEDRKAFEERAVRALTWLEKHAPENFRYGLNKTPVVVAGGDAELAALAQLRVLVAATDLEAIDAKDLNQKIYDDVIRKTECDAKAFFTVVYRKLISRDQGPRLPSFLKEIGRERLMELL